MNTEQSNAWVREYDEVKEFNKDLWMKSPPKGQFKVGLDWKVTDINTDLPFGNANANANLLRSSTLQLNESLIDCVTVQTREYLQDLLRRTCDDKEFHTDITIELISNDNNGPVRIVEINISPICDQTGNVTGVVFAKSRSFYSIMKDTSFFLLAFHICDKQYIVTSANSSGQSEFTYDTAKAYLISLGHNPEFYRGDDDNEGFYNNFCGKSWTKYMSTYVFYISTWMQKACYWSDIAMTDRLFSGQGAFQADHIYSDINQGNTTTVLASRARKSFYYNVKTAKTKELMVYLREGSKTSISHVFYHAILSREVSENLPRNIEPGRYAEQRVKLSSQILDDEDNRPFIERYQRWWSNPNSISFEDLKEFTLMCGIHLEDVAYFTEAMWNGYSGLTANLRKKIRITQIFYNTIIRLCGGCPLCYLLLPEDQYYDHRFLSFNMPVLGLLRSEYHHVIESKKRDNISEMRNANPIFVINELKKTVCLCTRHHFYITHGRMTPENRDPEQILSTYIRNQGYQASQTSGKIERR
jgi:hypothetical protein